MKIAENQKLLLAMAMLDQVNGPIDENGQRTLAAIKEIVSSLERPASDDGPPGKYFSTH